MFLLLLLELSSLCSVLSCDKGGLKKNQNARRPSEHPPVRGEKMSKRLGGDHRLQIQK